MGGMNTIYTAATAAEKIGCTTRTVQRLAQQHGIGSRFGHALTFTATDIRRLKTLRREKPGNPNGFAQWNLRRAEQKSGK